MKLNKFLIIVSVFLIFSDIGFAAEEKREESSIRRFEIIFLTSLPISAFYSFNLIQIKDMIDDNTMFPEFEKQDWQWMLTSTLAGSLFISIRDYFIHKKKVKNEDKISDGERGIDRNGKENKIGYFSFPEIKGKRLFTLAYPEINFKW